MKTHTVPRARNPRGLSGQLRLHYRLQSGLVLRQWEIVEVENVSFTYTDEPPPSPTNENKGNGGPGMFEIVTLNSGRWRSAMRVRE